MAHRIIAPVPFYGTNFSIVTAAKDPQLGTTDPLPVITQDGGRLTGQVTAWAAQWISCYVLLVALGAGLAWLRSKTGSVYPGMATHAIFNGIAVLTVIVR